MDSYGCGGGDDGVCVDGLRWWTIVVLFLMLNVGEGKLRGL